MGMVIIELHLTMHFHSFGVEYIPKQNKEIIWNKNIITNIYRIQAYDSISAYFCVGFIDFKLKGKSLLDHTSIFSTNDYEKNDKTMLKLFN